ncbi:MAG: YfhO family protein [Elusimicrobia bacterium]|nr:YfhO family protein [Elusimicrobiota bacterium]
MTRRDIRVLTLLLFFPAALFLYPFLSGKTIFVGDVVYSFQPWLTYAAQELQSGRLPLWNPYSACGEPFIGNPQTMIFYPAAALFWLFPFGPAYGMFLFLNQSLLSAGTFLLLRRLFPTGQRARLLLAVVAAAWCGGVVAHWEFPSAVATLAWAPFFLLFSLSPLGACQVCWKALSLATALLFLSCYTQFTYYIVLWGAWGAALMSLWALRAMDKPAAIKRLIYWLIGVTVGVLIAAVQILPTWELATQSLRTGIGELESRAHLLNPAFLIKFLIPSIIDKTTAPFRAHVFDPSLWPIQRAWLNTVFIGTAPFLLGLAALGRARRFPLLFLGGAGLFFAGLSLGWEPFYFLFRHALPGAKYMTHFSNALLFGAIALALLSAAEGSSRRNRFPIAGLWAAALGLCLLVAFSLVFRNGVATALLGLTGLAPSQHDWMRRAALQSAVVLAALGAAAALPARAKAIALVLLTAGELWVFGRDLFPFASWDEFHRAPSLAAEIRNSPHRLAFDPRAVRAPIPMAGATLEEGYQSVRQILRPNVHLPYRVHETWSYDVFGLPSFAEFRRPIDVSQGPDPRLRFLGARWVLSNEKLPGPFRLTAWRPNGLLFIDEDARQRVSWVPKAKVLSGKEGRLKYLSGRWDPAVEVIVDAKEGATAEGLSAPRAADCPRSSAERAEGAEGTFSSRRELHPPIFWRDGPGRAEASGATGEGWLVYSQAFYPGWKASVNGNPAKLWKANHAFQAVQVPAGKWEAVFLYRPLVFRIGLGVSAGTLVAFGFLIFAIGIRLKEKSAASDTRSPADGL